MDIKQIVAESRASIVKSDLEVLLNMAKSFDIRNILEIGTWKGYSAEVWIKAFFPNKFVTIEKEPKFSDAVEIKNINHKYFWNTNSHSNEIKFNTELYDFLFIDGDHSYGGVKKDFEMYSPLVKKGGLIVFHDIIYVSNDVNAPVQVKFLWDELKLKYNYLEIKTDQSSTGMGVLFI